MTSRVKTVDVKSPPVTTVARGRCTSLPVPEVVRVVQQVCASLGEAHDAAVLHRDLKPSNVLLDADDAQREAVRPRYAERLKFELSITSDSIWRGGRRVQSKGAHNVRRTGASRGSMAASLSFCSSTHCSSRLASSTTIIRPPAADATLELRGVAPRYAELRQRQVALDRHDALRAVLAPELVQLVQLADGLRPYQHEDRALALPFGAFIAHV